MEIKAKDNNNDTNQKVFDKAKSVLHWNKYLMIPLGLWPDSRNDIIFYSFFIYYCYCLILDYINFGLAMKSFKLMRMIGATMQNVTLIQIFVRVVTLKIFNKEFGEIINEFLKDFSVKNYRSAEERRIVLYYNARSKFFIKVVVTSLAVVAVLFFTKPLVRQLNFKHNSNKTFSYDLPYRIYSVYKITNVRIYILTYVSQIPILYLSAFTNTSVDCVTIGIVAHLCGQLGVLSVRISSTNFEKTPEKLDEIIKDHQRLIAIAVTLKKMYKILLLSHFIGATMQICVLVYQVLMSISAKEKTNFSTFFIFGFLSISRLYTLCWVGEYLIHESLCVSDAFYNIKWETLPVKVQKKLKFCIARSQKQLSLSAGNLSNFSLFMFANVMKSAMAYLSFLRNFV